ncbi:GH3 auxin-responsive promoter family protein [Amycolatopsis sp. NPDC059021]|uniref:GH3 auxin-responsive promoter family protein n=1 Tax=Amycolatopsis sp. NPDC059021 TaxID=3346704 RepID=UPI00366B6027
MSRSWGSQQVERYRRRVRAERGGMREALGAIETVRARVLATMLAENEDTAFGREHRFKNIRGWKDFRAAVPIRDYAAHAPWIERAAAGERGVLSADEPVVYFTSSGTTGDRKKIPVTGEFMRTGFFPPFYAAWASLVERFPEVISREDSTLNLKHDPVSRFPKTGSGHPHLGASQLDFGAAFGEPLAAEPGSRAPWGTLPVAMADDDHLGKAYVRLRLAAEHDVRCVIGINPAMVAALPYQLEQWWPRLVRELRDGTVAGRHVGQANPGRAAELERLASAAGVLLPAHLWPNFQVIFCWTGGLASLYLPRLKECFGPDVTVLTAPIAASEGFVGVALDGSPDACEPAVGAAFHEFVDADVDLRQDSETVSFADLEPGREYHVVLSHVGGLYRYALGDVVSVADRHQGIPRLTYAGRNTLSDVAGERLRESHVVRALRRALAASGREVHNATCRPVTPSDGRPRYEFAVAARETLRDDEAVRLAVGLDLSLTRLSDGYRLARAAGRLDPAVVRVLEADAFQRQWQARVADGVRPSQVKDRVFQRDDQAWRKLVKA